MTGTQSADAGSWTPFDAEADGQPTEDIAGSTDGDAAGERPRTDAHPGWRVIDGGHDAVDAAADEALAVVAGSVDEEGGADPAPVPPAPAVDPAPAAAPGPVQQTAPSTVEAPAQDPVETPAPAASEPDSTPHTPHPAPNTPEAETPAHTDPEAAGTPHSTPAWHAFAASLNPSGVLFRQQASLEEIVRYASDAPYSTSPAARALEVAWNRAVAVPVSLLLYSAAAAYKRLWRGLGTSTIGVLWIVAVHASPWDAQTVWTWTLLGYWAVSAFLVPVIVTTRK